MTAARAIPRIGVGAVVIVLAALPLTGVPAFYESFLYLMFYWISLATSWAILSGFAGYFSFGHAAFFGAGMYATAHLTVKLDVPFLASLPVAGAIAGLLAAGIGAVVFRLRSLRGELFALLTLAVTFVVATVILNTPIDGGAGVLTSSVPLPRVVSGSPSGTIYLLGLIMCVGTLATAWWVSRSRLGMGLFAIHDDEDVAEVKGVPTFRYKLLAFTLSGAIAGVVGGVHATYVGFLTVSETFGITVPLYVVLMSVLGGARHWAGPAVGATLIAASLYAFTGGDDATLGRGLVAFVLIVAILLMPQGIVPGLLKGLRRLRPAAPPTTIAAAPPATHAIPARSEAPVLVVHEVTKSFGGVRALRGVSLDVCQGEILGLVGPNGSGKTTLINMITGHFPLDGGTIRIDGQEIGHQPAHAIAQRGIARTYQIPRPFAGLTILDNVRLAAMFGGTGLTGNALEAEARHWLEFTGLGDKAASLPADLNLHERKFLELARALVTRPKLLLLDEVLSGLNPAEIDSAIALIRTIRDQGASIVFVEHLMRAVVQLSDRVVVMNEGATLAVGDPREVMRDPRVIAVYLGKAHVA